jgi:hypothetical protein
VCCLCYGSRRSWERASRRTKRERERRNTLCVYFMCSLVCPAEQCVKKWVSKSERGYWSREEKRQFLTVCVNGNDYIQRRKKNVLSSFSVCICFGFNIFILSIRYLPISRRTSPWCAWRNEGMIFFAPSETRSQSLSCQLKSLSRGRNDRHSAHTIG